MLAIGSINWEEYYDKEFGFIIISFNLSSNGSFDDGLSCCPFMPPPGVGFSQFEAPLDVDFQNTDMSGMKKGTAETISILGLVAVGDASSQAAAEDGGITKIVHADYEYFNVLA